ncbi:MAG: HupE/UreJ family protein [Myxococcales bacterium]|nr:HupE/UreJ family protein [Myxococcales bacterium]
MNSHSRWKKASAGSGVGLRGGDWHGRGHQGSGAVEVTGAVWLRLVAAAGALFASAAAAHDADIIYAQLGRAEGAEEVAEVCTLTAATLQSLAPVDADRDGEISEAELEAGREAIEAGVWEWMPLTAAESPCHRTGSEALLRETYVELRARYHCGPGELKQTFRVLSVLPAAYRVVLGSVVEGERGQLFAQGHQQTLIIPAKGRARRVSGLWSWIELGVFHIFTGVDHVCFLIALLLVAGGWRRVLVMVTAFTVAHSITLGATALEAIRLSPASARWVEAAIAASIVWVAVENLVLKQHRHRALITFAFGLVHGFGFASVLKGYGLGDDAVAGLFGFNLGVELGQAALVLAFYPLLRLLDRRRQAAVWAVRVASLAILGAGGYWLAERVLG